jgi:hypothetical protein
MPNVVAGNWMPLQPHETGRRPAREDDAVVAGGLTSLPLDLSASSLRL